MLPKNPAETIPIEWYSLVNASKKLEIVYDCASE
jgi:hypothetical protein